jgi:hypothetical protein
MGPGNRRKRLPVILISFPVVAVLLFQATVQEGHAASGKDHFVPPPAGYRRPLAQHFPDGKSDKVGKLLDQAEITIDVLIVTVPDPSDAHLAAAFDSDMAAIQAAMAERAFVPDSYWLPWGKSAEEAKQDDLVPGVLLFRSEPFLPPKRFVLLLLVAETPTTGVHRAAFSTAVKYAESVKPGLKKIPVIGPRFSGAAASLAEAVRVHAPIKFEFITGTATNRGVQDILPGTIATVLPDEVVIPALLDFARDRGLISDAGLVVILKEADTAYGRGFDLVAREIGARRPDGGPTGASTDGPRATRIIELPFPLHISQVGAAYQKRQEKSAEKTPIPANVQRLLELSIDEQVEPGDVVAALSPMTKYSTELQLANILAIVSRIQVQLVGIFATDPRDKIFLAREIRKFSPDVMLFTTEADLLYSHIDLRDELRGMLVGSSYPLTTQSQLWTPPFNSATQNFFADGTLRSPCAPDGGRPYRIQFPSSSAEGIYNAVQLSLNRFSPDAPERRHCWLLDYGEPLGELSGPQVWISIVGNAGFWPVDTRLPPVGHPPPVDTRLPPVSLPPPVAEEEARPGVLQSGPGATNALDPCAHPPGDPPAHKLSRLPFPRAHSQWLIFAFFALAMAVIGIVALWNPARLVARRWLSPAAVGLVMPPPRVLSDETALRAYRCFQMLGLLGLASVSIVEAACLVGAHATATRYGLCVNAPSLGALAFAGIAFSLFPAAVVASKFEAWAGARSSILAVQATAAFLAIASAFDFRPTTSSSPPPWYAFTSICVAASVPFLIAIVAAAFSMRSVPAKRRLIFGKLSDSNMASAVSALCLASVAVLLTTSLWFLADQLRGYRDGFFLYLRAVDWHSGVSPMIASGLVGLAILLISVFHLRRIALAAESRGRDAPLHWLFRTKGASRRNLRWLEDCAMRILEGRHLASSLPISVSFLIGFFLLVWGLWLFPTVEPDGWTWFVRIGFMVMVLSALHANLQLIVVWIRCRGALHLVAAHPVMRTFESLQKTVGAMLPRHAYAEAPHIGALALVVENRAPVLHREAKSALGARAPAAPRCETDKGGRLKYLRFWARNLEVCDWQDQPQARWVGPARDLLALEGAITIARIVLQVRTLILFVVCSSIIILAFVNAYPFHPHGRINLLVWWMILCAVVAILVVLFDMERNAVLSVLSGSTPGAVSWDGSFVWHLLLYVFVPLLGLLAVQFPEIGASLFHWLGPVLRSAG